MFGLKSLVMDAVAGEGGGGGASAPAVVPDAAAAPAASPAAAPAAAPAGTAPAAKPTALATQTADPDPIAWLPQKHRVMQADGTLDLEASARKNAEAYQGLEKRLGAGGAPPPSPGEYVIAAPEAMKDAFQPEDPGFKEFLTAAHASGMTQKQLDAAMGAFFNWAPKLAEAQQTFDIESCVTQLREVWTDQKEYSQNFAAADRALKTYAGERYGKLAEKFGNDPDAIWLLANFGKELREDRTVDANGPSAEDLRTLEAHPAYWDAKHPEHASVSSKVRELHAARARR